ncbi:MAG: tRNA (N6-isopentenyl adenosine(37)-C2)-methylthiotransferase MiaB [Elusimicrobiota bacterium]|jgi:tRNA-2-methylthio-N6-dimethylallyladenosine synthase|nr:tRNA (N6-isopentenyl adenosine(37)-C2)-methylthiotransferase MiaB [Elusimicrobiota bacterium]
MNFKIETIGCQMNVNESDNISQTLISLGAAQTDDINDADIVILNTCSVRAQAEQKAFSFLGRAQELKSQKKDIKIAVIGCMAQRLGLKIKNRFKSADLIVGTKDLDNAAQKIAALFDKPLIRHCGQDRQSPAISSFVTIMRGCDNYCSYCIVPFVRGRQTSIDSQIIFDECINKVKNGTKEISLLGQNVNSYLYNGLNFSGLLKQISQIDGLERIRFMTNHPKDLSDELIDTAASLDKVCKHIHLPMQSASNVVLDAMNRKYSYEHYLGLVQKLRNKISNISITTDIIVGFPNEEQKDFEETLEAVEYIRFDGLYAFRYSPRPQTKSALMPDAVPLEEKKRRHRIILSRSNEISSEIVSKMIGSKIEVLVENYENGILHTRTQGGRKIFVEGKIEQVGKILPVIVKKAKINALFGDMEI